MKSKKQIKVTDVNIQHVSSTTEEFSFSVISSSIRGGVHLTCLVDRVSSLEEARKIARSYKKEYPLELVYIEEVRHIVTKYFV